MATVSVAMFHCQYLQHYTTSVVSRVLLCKLIWLKSGKDDGQRQLGNQTEICE